MVAAPLYLCESCVTHGRLVPIIFRSDASQVAARRSLGHPDRGRGISTLSIRANFLVRSIHFYSPIIHGRRECDDGACRMRHLPIPTLDEVRWEVRRESIAVDRLCMPGMAVACRIGRSGRRYWRGGAGTRCGHQHGRLGRVIFRLNFVNVRCAAIAWPDRGSFQAWKVRQVGLDGVALLM